MIAAVPVELTDAALAAEVVDGLALVEKQLAEATQSEEELLAEASTHLLEAGGKRFRATLVLLAAHFGNPPRSARSLGRDRGRADPSGHPVPRRRDG